jgi:hypothetical protein
MATPPLRPGPAASERGDLILPAVGLVYVAAGVVFGVAYLVGGVTSSLFPTGWILPAVLVITGGLMALRRRFDIVGALWAALTLAVFLIDLDVYFVGLELRLVDPAAFDATIIVGALGLVTLILRPRFRS